MASSSFAAGSIAPISSRPIFSTSSRNRRLRSEDPIAFPSDLSPAGTRQLPARSDPGGYSHRHQKPGRVSEMRAYPASLQAAYRWTRPIWGRLRNETSASSATRQNTRSPAFLGVEPQSCHHLLRIRPPHGHHRQRISRPPCHYGRVIPVLADHHRLQGWAGPPCEKVVEKTADAGRTLHATALDPTVSLRSRTGTLYIRSIESVLHRFDISESWPVCDVADRDADHAQVRARLPTAWTGPGGTVR